MTVDNRTSLLDLLREQFGLTGSEKVCNAGACGACTVLLEGHRVNSCLTLAVRLEGAEVTTVEGLADGDELHPLQQAFIDEDAFQCGYCAPGQIMSGVGCIKEGHTGSPEEIRECRAPGPDTRVRLGRPPGRYPSGDHSAGDDHPTPARWNPSRRRHLMTRQ